MKKLLFSAFMMVAAATTFTSCQKEVQPIAQQSLSSQIGADADFVKMMDASIALGQGLTNDFSTEDAEFIATVINKGGRASQAEKAQVKAILGTNAEEFGKSLETFATSFQALEARYKLSAMSSTELTNTIQAAINSNVSLKSKLTATANVNGKAAVTGAAICKLVVLLAKTLGGGPLCTAIGVSTIPVVGGVLCTALVTVASNILNAACDLIP